ncbi:glycosyltransferase family 4 protein [Dickeya oryzae]|nr:glycosyltransferase family 4 protein [Dickeya oryzae]
MNVLHFYKTYHPDTFGGVEQVIYQLCEKGHKYNINASVLSLSENVCPGEQAVGNHQTWKVKTDFEVASSPFSRSAFYKFKELSKQADVIHYHFPWPFMDVVDLLSNIDKPKVVSYHSDIIRQKYLLRVYQPLMNRFLGKVDRIVATSPNYVETSDILKKYQSKVDVIPIGIDRMTYPPLSDSLAEKWRARLGDRYFLFIGKLRYYKGLHFLIEASLGAKYPIVIVGSGPEEDSLKKMVSNTNSNNIHFLGELSEIDKMAVLRGCYCFVFPSHLRSEAFGVSLLEAAMEAKPLISCEIGTGTTYINIDKVTGLVVQPENPFMLRTAMDKLWDSPELAEAYGQAALERFSHMFTADQMAEKYSSIYQELTRM